MQSKLTPSVVCVCARTRVRLWALRYAAANYTEKLWTATEAVELFSNEPFNIVDTEFTFGE